MSAKLPRHSYPVSFCRPQQWTRIAKHNKRSTLTEFCLMIFLIASMISQCYVAEAADSGYLSAPDSSRKCICSEDLNPFDKNIDRFSVTGKVSPNYSTRWNVTYHNYYKRITVKLASNSDIAVIYAYVCGAPKLTASERNTIHGDAIDATVKITTEVEIPFRSVGLYSTTMVPPLEYIGHRYSIVHLNADYTTFNSCVRKLYDLGKVTENDVNFYAKVLAAHATQSLDAIIVNPPSYTSYNTSVNNMAALSSSVKVIPMTEYRESTYLGIAEYVEFMALFFNRELAAKNVADNINLRFTCTANQVTQANKPKPKVLIASGSFYGYFGFTCPQWKCHMVENAGGEIIQFSYTDNHTEFIQNYVSQADVWIYDNANWNMSYIYGGPYLPEVEYLLKDTNVYKNKRVYDIRRQSYNDWFTTAQAEPDVLLRDFVSVIFDGQDIIGTHTRKFLRNVFTETAYLGEGGDPATCTDVNKATYNDWTTTGCALEGPGDPVIIPGLGGDSGVTYASCPTPNPTSNPTSTPTRTPTSNPTHSPSKFPSTSPTIDPTKKPTTYAPTNVPTLPTSNPTNAPTVTPTTKVPTKAPIKSNAFVNVTANLISIISCLMTMAILSIF